MTAAQFDALSILLRLREGGQKEAARLVLVEGVAQAEAARRVSIKPQAVGNTIRACRLGLALAEKACGLE